MCIPTRKKRFARLRAEGHPAQPLAKALSPSEALAFGAAKTPGGVLRASLRWCALPGARSFAASRAYRAFGLPRATRPGDGRQATEPRSRGRRSHAQEGIQSFRLAAATHGDRAADEQHQGAAGLGQRAGHVVRGDRHSARHRPLVGLRAEGAGEIEDSAVLVHRDL